MSDTSRAEGRIRREPPAFRKVAVVAATTVTPRLMRVTVGGPELDGFSLDQPAASVRLLLPQPGTGDLVMPSWNGNVWLLPDGTRATIRTLTPLRFDPGAQELDLEIVMHESGAAPAWARTAKPGDRTAISGPARGYPIDSDASGFVLAGDESAIPAIGQLLEALPPDKPVHVTVEVADPAGRVELPKHPTAGVDWYDLPPGAPPGDTLVAALTAADLVPGTRIWAAGEAAAMQRIRRHILDERQIPRSETWIRGYWKSGRTEDSGDDD